MARSGAPSDAASAKGRRAEPPLGIERKRYEGDAEARRDPLDDRIGQGLDADALARRGEGGEGRGDRLAAIACEDDAVRDPGDQPGTCQEFGRKVAGQRRVACAPRRAQKGDLRLRPDCRMRAETRRQAGPTGASGSEGKIQFQIDPAPRVGSLSARLGQPARHPGRRCRARPRRRDEAPAAELHP